MRRQCPGICGAIRVGAARFTASLLAGKTDRDIGAILGISPRAVHKHLQRIYDKLGVETRTAAVMRWLRRR